MDIIVEKHNQKICIFLPVTFYSTLSICKMACFNLYSLDFKRTVKNLLKNIRHFIKKYITDIDFEIEFLDKYTKVISNYEGFIIEGWMGDFVL